MTVAAPDYFEPVLGWRMWLVMEHDRALHLRSVVFEISWPPRQELVAGCERSPRRLLNHFWRPRPVHEAPSVNCECGIHAAKTAEHAAEYLSGYDDLLRRARHRVIGRVQLWGSVVETEFGWRASHAYPACIYVPTHCGNGLRRVDAETIALGLAGYGVPVEIVSEFECLSLPSSSSKR